jgi:nitrogen regulatory protein PII
MKKITIVVDERKLASVLSSLNIENAIEMHIEEYKGSARRPRADKGTKRGPRPPTSDQN